MAKIAKQQQDGPQDGAAPCNEVLLVGRMAAVPVARTLPSGDAVLTWRVVVERPERAATVPRRATVDTVDCVAFAAGVRRTVSSWQAGDVVRVEGALRRRFWRGPTGTTSRYEVEASAVRRVLRGA